MPEKSRLQFDFLDPATLSLQQTIVAVLNKLIFEKKNKTRNSIKKQHASAKSRCILLMETNGFFHNMKLLC